jgi:hypothetical protein
LAKALDYWNVRSLDELFDKLSLGQYKTMFREQEIDLPTFLTLTETDLKELGVATFGARRKMNLGTQQQRQHHQQQRQTHTHKQKKQRKIPKGLSLADESWGLFQNSKS